MPHAPLTSSEPAFTHESHLAWEQLQERGHLLPGWVTRHRQVKAINQYITLRTYRQVVAGAPVPDGFSWANLDHCGGWSRWWHTADGTSTDDSAVLVERVLSGQKIAGSVYKHPSTQGGFDEVTATVEAAPGYTMNITTAGNPNFLAAWIAPDKYLGEVVDIDLIADFYAHHGIPPYLLDGAEDIYLPDQGVDGAFDKHHPVITGLILGYPPASTLSILFHG